MGAEKDKKKKRYRRLKFPQTRRDRLKGSNERDTRYVQGISRLSSIHSGLNDGRGYYPSITGRSLDDVSLSMPSSMGQMPRPQYANYSMDTDIPLAPHEESWSEWGRRGPPMPLPQFHSEDMPDSNGQYTHPAVSPTGGSRVVFSFPEDEGDETRSALPKRLSSEAGSLGFDDTRDAGGRSMPLQPIREYDPSNVSSLILFGPEIATKWDFFFPIISILGYLADTGSDIWLAYKYYSMGHNLWFILTLLLILLPSIAMTIFSLILWVRNSIIVKDPVQRWQWACRILSLLFMMSPLTRLADVIYYAYQSRNSKRDWYHRRKFYERMLDEDTDCNLVRLFETFLENAPQLVLQLYVMTQLGTDEGVYLVVVQCFGLLTSWFTMTWSLVAFHTALRASLPDKARLTNWGKVGMFMWRLFMIASRVVALALFASYFKWYVLVFAAAHFLVMFLWMTKQQTVYCMFKVLNEEGKVEVHHSEILELFFRVMAAFVHIFCFLNLLEGPSRLRCIAYYCLVYAENFILVMLWYVAASTLSSSWFHMPALLLVLLGFWAGVGCQAIYYMCCHPNRYHAAKSDKLIRTCVPCAELSLFQDLQYYEDSSQEEAESLRHVMGPRGHSSSHNTSVSRSRTLLEDPTSSIEWDPQSYVTDTSYPMSSQYPSQGTTPMPSEPSYYGPGPRPVPEAGYYGPGPRQIPEAGYYGPGPRQVPEAGYYDPAPRQVPEPGPPRGRRISEILPPQGPMTEPTNQSPQHSVGDPARVPPTQQSPEDPARVSPTHHSPREVPPTQSPGDPSSPGQMSPDVPSPAAHSSPEHPHQRPQTLPLSQPNSPTRRTTDSARPESQASARSTGTSSWKRNPTPPREPILQCKTTLV